MWKLLVISSISLWASPCESASSLRTVQTSPTYFADAIIALDEHSPDFSKCLADIEQLDDVDLIIAPGHDLH